MRNLTLHYNFIEEEFLELLVRQDLNFIKSLVNYGVNVNLKNKFGGTGLHIAVYELNILAIEYFLSQGADINAEDNYNQTPLYYIFFKNRECDLTEVVELLLSRGAKIDARDINGNTPLHYAAYKGSLNLVEFFLKNNAEVKSITKRTNLTPLVRAIESGNIEVVKLLVRHGADVNGVDESGYRNPLNWACKGFIESGNLEIIEYLLEIEANVNSAEHDDETLLHIAIYHNLPALLPLLFKYNINIHLKNSLGESALVYAIRREDLDLVKNLINRGADVNNIDKNISRTPLNWACNWRNIEIIECLLENGADPDEVQSDGLSPLLNVLNNMLPSLVVVESSVKLLLSYGADVNILGPDGCNVLSIDRLNRCSNLILQHVAKLLELKLPVNSKIIDDISCDDNFHNYFEECKEELLIAKNTKLRDCWVTFFNILTDDLRKLIKYAGNKSLIEDFEKTSLMDKFPIYGCTMHTKMSKGLRIRKLWNTAADTLGDVLKILNPTHLIVRDILDCLNEKDLSKLDNQVVLLETH